MAKTSRRNLLKGAAAGGVAAGFGLLGAETNAAETPEEWVQHLAHTPLFGLLANATVSFGQWQTSPPVDRFPNNSPRFQNQHQLIPHTAIVQAGGAVNFIIGGFHHVLVYAPGTRPTDIDVNNTTPTTGTPAGVPLINDARNRIYRGLDPSLHPQDRVEVVHFPNRGLYLVICGVLPHFVDDDMFGFVRVL
jgi:hypothetical protein